MTGGRCDALFSNRPVSAACAALVAASRRSLTGRRATVVVDGGELDIHWDEATGHVLMTGPVEVERTGMLAV